MSNCFESLKTTLRQMEREDHAEDQLRSDTYIQQLHDEIQRLADRVAQLERHPKFAMVGGAGGLSSKSIADLGTKDHDLLDGLLDDDHTQYELAAATRGNVDIGANAILTTDLAMVQVTVSRMGFLNRAQTAYRDFTARELACQGFSGTTTTCYFACRNVSGGNFDIRTYFGGVQTVAKAIDGEFQIPRAGDIIMLATKSVDAYTNAGYIKLRRLSQSAEPTPDVGELLLWRDTDDDKTYLVYEDVDLGGRKIELT